MLIDWLREINRIPLLHSQWQLRTSAIVTHVHKTELWSSMIISGVKTLRTAEMNEVLDAKLRADFSMFELTISPQGQDAFSGFPDFIAHLYHWIRHEHSQSMRTTNTHYCQHQMEQEEQEYDLEEQKALRECDVKAKDQLRLPFTSANQSHIKTTVRTFSAFFSYAAERLLIRFRLIQPSTIAALNHSKFQSNEYIAHLYVSFLPLVFCLSNESDKTIQIKGHYHKTADASELFRALYNSENNLRAYYSSDEEEKLEIKLQVSTHRNGAKLFNSNLTGYDHHSFVGTSAL